MNLEFHYYTTYFLAVKAGFSERDAEILSYSCQYVDHNLRAWDIEATSGVYPTSVTQNYTYWQKAVVRDVYLPFHFFPIGPKKVASVRKDSKINLYDVRPNSPGVKELLVAALKTKDLYRIGIALHTFADTWAHQNFSALADSWNKLEERSLVPPAGHAQAGWKPDLWLTVWTDSRLKEEQIDNRTRFLECARKIYRYLCIFKGKDFHLDEEFVYWELKELVEAGKGRSDSAERMMDFLIWGSMNPYDRNLWTSEAFEIPAESKNEAWFPGWEKFRGMKDDFLEKTGLLARLRVKALPHFKTSHFFLWMEAAKAHRLQAFQILDATFSSWRRF